MALLLPPTPVPSLAAYVDGGGGEGLATALELTPEEVGGFLAEAAVMQVCREATVSPAVDS